MTGVGDTLKAAAARLAAAGCDSPRLDADILLEHVTGIARARRYLDLGEALPDAEAAAFEALVARRERHEPVAYLTGTAEFWSLTFEVSPATLIPRADTETLVEVVLKRIAPPSLRRGEGRGEGARSSGIAPACITTPSPNPLPQGRGPAVLDLGTGTGCILLSLLTEWPAATGAGVDLNPEAVALAAGNAVRHGLADRARFRAGSWFAPVAGERFDIILSNPPYIPVADLDGLMPDVRLHEPMAALDGGADGFDAYREIIDHAPGYLAENGLLALEAGIGQAEGIAALMRSRGYAEIEIAPDLAGILRVVSGIWRNP